MRVSAANTLIDYLDRASKFDQRPNVTSGDAAAIVAEVQRLRAALGEIADQDSPAVMRQTALDALELCRRA